MSARAVHRLLGALAILFAPATGEAQEVRVTPGDPRLMTTAIRESVDTFDLMLRQDGQSQLVSTVRTRIVRGEQGGVPVLVLIQQYDGPSGISADSTTVDARTLAPLAYRYHGAQVHRLTFEGTRVTGVIEHGDSSTTIAASDIVPFFNAVADGLLLSALPLRAGTAITYRAFNPPNRFTDVRMRVEADTMLIVRGDEMPALRISYDAGAAPTTMWVARRDGRLIQSVSTLPDGREFWRVRPERSRQPRP